MGLRSSACMLLVLLLPRISCAAAVNAQATQKSFTKIVTDLRVESRQAWHLDNDRLVVVRDGKRKAIPVVLELVIYKYRLLKKTAEETRDVGQRTLYCCEMRAKNPADAYSWYVWSSSDMGEFRLFNTPDLHNYLAWASTDDLCFAEVSKPADKSARLDAYMAASGKVNEPGIERVPVTKLVPEREGCTWGVNALYSEIIAVSLGKDQDGNWLLEVSPPVSDRVYRIFTVVSDKTTKLGWRLVE